MDDKFPKMTQNNLLINKVLHGIFIIYNYEHKQQTHNFLLLVAVSLYTIYIYAFISLTPSCTCPFALNLKYQVIAINMKMLPRLMQHKAKTCLLRQQVPSVYITEISKVTNIYAILITTNKYRKIYLLTKQDMIKRHPPYLLLNLRG